MAVAVAVAVSGGGAVAVAGLTKRYFNHIQKDFLINIWGCCVYIFFATLGAINTLSSKNFVRHGSEILRKAAVLFQWRAPGSGAPNSCSS